MIAGKRQSLKEEHTIAYWCDAHNREATHTNKRGKHECDPKLGGITIPCHVVKLTDVVVDHD